MNAAPKSASSPEEEVTQLTSLLAGAEKSFGSAESLEPFLYATSMIASRIDVFEMRFRVKPQAVPQWKELTAQAARLLKRVDGKRSKDVYFNADSAEAGTCMLLELAGKPSAALHRLDRIKPGGGCGNWWASVMLAVNQQKAGIYQRSGDYKAAFACLQAEEASMDLALGVPEPDLFHCRYAFLAAKNDRPAEARQHYQTVVDLYPHTIGDEIARKALAATGELIEPDLKRINRVYLEDSETSNYDAAIFAIGAHRFPGSFDDLKAKLDAAEPWQRNRIIPALGQTGDARVLPTLQAIAAKNADNANVMHALAALGRLGDRSQVRPYLQRLVQETQQPFLEGSWLDDVLREIYGDGPAALRVAESFDISSQTLAQRWLDWIEHQGSPTPNPKA